MRLSEVMMRDSGNPISRLSQLPMDLHLRIFKLVGFARGASRVVPADAGVHTSFSAISRQTLVDPKGVEPLSSACKAEVLPLNERPTFKT